MMTSRAVPAIELSNVSKNYGKVNALQKTNLSIEAGEIIAFLGPNGAGKSTTISLMLGLRRPSSGEVRLFGENPRLARQRKHIGVMLQEPGLPSVLTVSELVELFGRFHDHAMETREAISLAGLEKQANTRLGRLSGGQKQRAYFALALVGNPDVLLLDEPTVGLDVEARHNFWEQITRQVALGKTIIITTHNLEEADALARRIIVINRGQVIADDTPEKIKQHVGGKLVSFSSAQLGLEDLQMLPETQHLRLVGHRFEIYSMQPERLLSTLFRNGYEINDLQVVGAGLEEAFLALTAHKER